MCPPPASYFSPILAVSMFSCTVVLILIDGRITSIHVCPGTANQHSPRAEHLNRLVDISSWVAKLKVDYIEIVYTTLIRNVSADALHVSKDYSNFLVKVIEGGYFQNNRRHWHRGLSVLIFKVYNCRITAPPGGIMSKTM